MQNLDKRYFYPCILQAVPTDEYVVYAYFNDGSVRRYDMADTIREGTVFEPLKDIEVFKSKITVMHDTVAWDLEGNRDPEKVLDIDPLTIFAEPMVDDPLEEKLATIRQAEAMRIFNDMRAKAAKAGFMTAEEIEAEIAAARKERKPE